MVKHADTAIARIGPNAILQVIQALGGRSDEPLMRRVFEDANLAHYLDHPPTDMVDEREVTALHRSLREILGLPEARTVSREAGRLTGEYLLANRIPAPAQWVLKRLPAGLAGPLLMKAMAANAWTFAGSGVFSYTTRRPFRLTIAGSPICADTKAGQALCDFYCTSFERLFRELVSTGARVTEVECRAQGDSACVFEVDLSQTARGADPARRD